MTKTLKTTKNIFNYFLLDKSSVPLLHYNSGFMDPKEVIVAS